MSLVIATRPATYAASANPIVYRGYRADNNDIIEVTDQGGFARIKVDNDVTADFEIDDQIYLRAEIGIYDDIGNITNVALSAGDTLIDTDIPFTAAYDQLNGQLAFINNLTKRAGYKVRVQIFSGDDDSLLVDDTFQFTTDRSAELMMDIQAALADLLSPEIEMCPSIYTEVQDTGRFKHYYIKYLELWTGSSESYTSDSGNKRYVVLGGMQIGNNNDMDELDTGIPTVMDRIRLFIGRYNDLPLFHVAGFEYLMLMHTLGDTLVTVAALPMADVNQGVGRVKLDATTSYDTIRIAMATAALSLDPPNTSWTDLSGTTTKGATTIANTAAGANSSITYQAFAGVPDQWIVRFGITITITGTWTGTVSVTFGITTSGVGSISKIDTTYGLYQFDYTVNAAAEAKTVTMKVLGGPNQANPNVPTAATTRLRVHINKNLSAGNADVTVTLTTNMDSALAYNESLQNGPTLYADVVSPCDNPVTLGWTNRYGQFEWWTFENNQELSVVTETGKKAKRLLLTATGLTADQWEAMSDLYAIGEIYRTAIPEQTEDVLATAKQIGHQVYMVDPDDDERMFGVVVVPGNPSTMTKQASHNFSVIIELPEYQLAR